MTKSVCTCARIRIGFEVTEHRNWNPDCPVHPELSEAAKKQVERSVEMQLRAAEARKRAREAP